jgi:hypothetical protein
MKKISLVLLIIFCFAACGGGGDDGGNNESRMQEITLDETVTGKIDHAGDVDWYHVNLVERDRTLSVNLSGTRQNSPVDFMLTVYEKNASGEMVPIFGESAKEDVFQPADITIDVAITQPKHLYFAVRDFKDDDASDLIPYRLMATYSDETEENNSFEDAIELQVGSGQICNTDENIYPASDVDCFRFTIGGANPAGVYRIVAHYELTNSAPMPVNLGLELYNDGGQLVQAFKGQKPADNLYVLLSYLNDGTYYLVLADQGRNHESQYNYSVCIEPVTAEEAMENDVFADADRPTLEPDGGHISANLIGSLEYIQDEDWYVFDVPAATTGAFKIMSINFFHNFDQQVPAVLEGQVKPAGYRVRVLNSGQEVIHSFDQSVLLTESTIVELEVDAGADNYIVVKPIYHEQMLMALPYQFTVTVKDVSDPNESETPIVLQSGDVATGKIYKAGDVDTYQIDVVTNGSPKVLELFFNTSEASEVSYVLTAQWSGNTRMIRDANGAENGAACKSSFYLAQDETVALEVRDDQNNDGGDVEYSLRVNVLDPADSYTPPAVESGTTPHYFSESAERAADGSTSTEVTVIEFNNDLPHFKANTNLLRVGQLINNTWTSEWIAGFVDYDGDRDIFELNFDDVIPQGPDATWHFDIQVQIVAAAGPVEYSWTLFRDRAPANHVLVERTFWVIDPDTGEEVQDPDGDFEFNDEGEGIVASWADDSLASNAINETIPSGGDSFWIGNRWADSDFYISINDFDYTRIGGTEPPTLNQTPDNDWGNIYSSTLGVPFNLSAVAPYYFQVTVTYHADCASPDEGACAQ